MWFAYQVKPTKACLREAHAGILTLCVKIHLSLCTLAVFFFITPHLTSWNHSITNVKDWDQNKFNIHGYTQKDMSETIKAVCNEYNIPVIDMYDFTVKLYSQYPTKYKQEYGGDGIHPTAVCHKLMAEYILFEFAKQ